MSEDEVTSAKIEADKSYVWLEAVDGSIHQVEKEVAMFCPVIHRELLNKGMKSSKTDAVFLPKQVVPSFLVPTFELLRFPLCESSDKEFVLFAEDLIRKTPSQWDELLSTVEALEICSSEFAWLISVLSTKAFNVLHLKHSADLIKRILEALKIPTGVSYIHSSNQPRARHRKSLKKQQDAKSGETQMKQEDPRSVEELLEFINANDGADTKSVEPSKLKKRKRRRKNQVKDSSQREKSKVDVKVGTDQCDAIPSHDAVTSKQDGSHQSSVDVDKEEDDRCVAIFSHDAITTKQDGSDQFSTDIDEEEDDLDDREKMAENDRIVAILKWKLDFKLSLKERRLLENIEYSDSG